MRAFAKPMSIERLSREARLIYSSFCVFMLLGYASNVWLYLDDGLDPKPSSAVRYYLGDPEPTSAGPDIAMPSDMGAPELRFRKPARQVLETFHFHLFSMSVCLMIIAHIFMMCRVSSRLKLWTIAIGSVATLLHLCTPVLIRFVSPHFATLMFPTSIIMTMAWLIMTLRPLFDMWRRPVHSHSDD